MPEWNITAMIFKILIPHVFYCLKIFNAKCYNIVRNIQLSGLCADKSHPPMAERFMPKASLRDRGFILVHQAPCTFFSPAHQASHYNYLPGKKKYTLQASESSAKSQALLPEKKGTRIFQELCRIGAACASR